MVASCGAKFGKYCHKPLFSKKFVNFFYTFIFYHILNIFMPKFCHLLKYQLLLLTKQAILNYLSNEYPNFREKTHLNINRCNLSL